MEEVEKWIEDNTNRLVELVILPVDYHTGIRYNKDIIAAIGKTKIEREEKEKLRKLQEKYGTESTIG